MDPERLISAVEQRPCIWDVYSEDYHDRSLTRMAWLQVCRELHPGFEDMTASEQNAIMTNTQKRWRNFRDCFVKDLKATRRFGSSQSLKRRKYIFSDRLAFLTRSVETKINASLSMESPDDLPDEERPEQKYRPPEGLAVEDYSDGGKLLTDRVVDRLYPICDLDDRTGHSSTAPDRKEHWPLESLTVDDDIAFFYSLLPTVRKLNEETKLEFRMEVMKMLKKLKMEQLHSDHAAQQRPSTSISDIL